MSISQVIFDEQKMEICPFKSWSSWKCNFVGDQNNRSDCTRNNDPITLSMQLHVLFTQPGKDLTVLNVERSCQCIFQAIKFICKWLSKKTDLATWPCMSLWTVQVMEFVVQESALKVWQRANVHTNIALIIWIQF